MKKEMINSKKTIPHDYPQNNVAYFSIFNDDV